MPLPVSLSPARSFLPQNVPYSAPRRSCRLRSLQVRRTFPLSAINSVGITVVVVTHEHELARHFSKRVITIDHGNVIGDSQNRQDAGEDAGEVIL